MILKSTCSTPREFASDSLSPNVIHEYSTLKDFNERILLAVGSKLFIQDKTIDILSRKPA